MIKSVLYHLAFPREMIYTKSLVYGIYALEFFQTVVVVDAGFKTLVMNFMDPYVFDKIGLLWLIPPLTAIGGPPCCSAPFEIAQDLFQPPVLSNATMLFASKFFLHHPKPRS